MIEQVPWPLAILCGGLLVRWKVCEILQAIGTKASLPELEKVAKDLGGPADQAITAIKGRS
jgi:hypothetical protein